MHKKSLLLLSILCIALGARAQSSDLGAWYIYFGNVNLKKGFNWHHEVQYRNYNFGGDLQQLLLRTGIGYNLTEGNNNLLLGYGFINSQNYINADTKLGNNEHRIYQQFITRQSFGRVSIQHRYRVEERFLENDFQLRFRYFLALNVAISSKTMQQGTVYLSAYNEIFLNGQNSYFDRNRLYGAIGYLVNPNLRIEAGFMAQTSQQNNRNQFQLVIFNNFPKL